MCGKWTFGEITWKRIVGNENITSLTILGAAFRDITVIEDKLMLFKKIKNLHLTWINLDESFCIPKSYTFCVRRFSSVIFTQDEFYVVIIQLTYLSIEKVQVIYFMLLLSFIYLESKMRSE